MTGHILIDEFIDESKQKGYVTVAAVLLPVQLRDARKTMRTLVMPGQRRVHFRTERDSRRRQIIDAMATTGGLAYAACGTPVLIWAATALPTDEEILLDPAWAALSHRARQSPSHE